jgi:hypothetical protein
MITASCHCGAVQLEIESAPATVTDCNCTICRRYGVLWAYYSPTKVSISGATDTYTCGDKMLAFHRCTNCGCVTHWAGFDASRDRMGVNARLMEPDVVAAVRVRHLDGAVTWEYLD